MPAVVLSFIFGLLLGPGLKAESKKRRHRLAHVHGEAQLSIAVDGQGMEVLLQTPADGVLGFEHEPRNDAERKVVAAARNKLKSDILKIVRIPEELACVAVVKAMNIQLAQPRRSKRDEILGLPASPKGHGDITVRYAVNCAKTLTGSEAKIDVHGTFTRIKKTRLTLLTDRAQISKVLTVKPVTIKL